MKQGSSRLRRQVLRHIELKLSPQPSFTPPRPTSRAECKTAAFAAIHRRGRTSGRDFGRLRSNSGSKLLHTGRRRRDLIAPLQTAVSTFVRPARCARSVSLFTDSSQRTSVGTKTITDHPLRFLISLQANNVTKKAVRISAEQFDSSFEFQISSFTPPLFPNVLNHYDITSFSQQEVHPWHSLFRSASQPPTSNSPASTASNIPSPTSRTPSCLSSFFPATIAPTSSAANSA